MSIKIKMKEFVDEVEDLVDLIVNETWEYYGNPNVTPESVRKACENGHYVSEGTRTFWIQSEINETLGMLRIFELNDGTPRFDIRIPKKFGGQGVGTEAVKWLVDFVFQNYEEINRVEGNTRQDNYAMRCVFAKCGFVKEAHYRKGWECSNGDVYDAMGYGITREDWKRKIVTPVVWNDFKC